ncbi:glycosyltransferase [Peribacillus muralis]|uniref:CgeB family protein n=1 Tax=Peribacillus muralis TaxID=264697 RepID=UPI00070924F6|nr:glycosyltransferase [Peribacillus muralis]
MFKENDSKNWNEGFENRSKEIMDLDGTNVRLSFLDKKVLYVHPVHGGTYKVISQGIIEGLRNLVCEVYTAKADQDVANLAAQINPDLVLVLLGDTFPIDQVKAIRAMGIKTAVWFTDDPYYTNVTTKKAPYYHYVFSQEISCVSYYQLLGSPQVHYLPLAVNTKVFHYQREDDSFLLDVCFLGTAWNDRISLFDQIAPYLFNKNVLIVGPNWNRMFNYYLLSNKIRLEVLSPEESARLINQSKIVINNHRSYDDNTVFNNNSNKLPALSINPRTFEISACGAFQLSDVRQELNRYYERGKEIETYSSPSELIEKIDHYLSHEDERNMIARKGHSKTLKMHTYSKRLVTLLNVIFG